MSVPKIAPYDKIKNVNSINTTQIADDAVTAAKEKIVTRDLSVAIGETSATATNAADINGVVLGYHFIAASADSTATEITGVRFVPTTGALTASVNAAATAATVIRVSILQA